MAQQVGEPGRTNSSRDVLPPGMGHQLCASCYSWAQSLLGTALLASWLRGASGHKGLHVPPVSTSGLIWNVWVHPSPAVGNSAHVPLLVHEGLLCVPWCVISSHFRRLGGFHVLAVLNELL